MENARSNSKMKVKVKTLNENVSPLQMEIDDGRGRYLQSMAMSPRFQPYAENIDAGGSPLPRYFFAGSPISGKVSPAGGAFPSPTFGSSKYSRPAKACSNSSGNSSFGSRGRLSLSPLCSVENLEPLRSPPAMYGTPVKVDEEVLVMDDILVRPTSVGKSGRSSSSSSSRGSLSSSWSSSWSPPFVKSVFKTESGGCRCNSKCQVARGKEELHPTCLSMKSKSEAHTSKSSMSAGSSIHGPNSRRTVHQHHAAAEPEDAVVITSQPASSEDTVVITSQPASPVKPEPHHTLANPNASNDWSPLDDGIEVVLPNGSDKTPSREEVDAYIFGVLHGPTAKSRLPAFEKICKGQ